MKQKDRPRNHDADNTCEIPLQSWKEIATYLERGERTARRWEKVASLPVRRHGEGKGSSVYAYPSELDAWRAEREPRANEIGSPSSLWRWSIPVALGTLGLLAGVWFIKYSPILNPPNPVVEADGTKIRQIWAGPHVDPEAAVSPDGQYLSFVGNTGDLTLRDLAAETNRRLAGNGDWSEFALYSVFSPDSKQIAYAWFNEDLAYDLRLIGVDGSGPRVLYQDAEVEFIKPLGWSSDGAQLLVTLYRDELTDQIGCVSIADGSLRILKTLPHSSKELTRFWRGASLSPDGRYIVYDSPQQEQEQSDRDIFVLSTETQHEIPLVQHPANDHRPIWTPDGKRIVFLSDRTGTKGLWSLRVTGGKPDGSPTLVKSEFGQNLPMGFTHDGAFYYGVGTKMYDVYIAKLDFTAGKVLEEPTQVSQRFVGSNWWPDWSPDGKSLSYVSRRNRRAYGSRIVIRSLATGEEREITPNLPFFNPPRWSIDGSFLLASSRHRAGQRGLFKIDPKTGEATAIHEWEPNPIVLGGTRSRDGKTIFYHVQNKAEKIQTLKVHNLQTDQKRELYQAPWSSGMSVLSLSRDGKYLAFRLGNQETGDSSLHAIPTAGGQPRELLRVKRPEMLPYKGYEWTPDGKEILFVKAVGDPFNPREQKAELIGVSVQGGELRKFGLAKERLGHIRIHPDGSLLAFMAGPYQGEVWVMEDFLPTLMAAK